VKFDNISVNENQQVYAGKINAISEGIEAFLKRVEEERGPPGAGSGDDFEGKEEKIDGVMDSVYFNDEGQIVVITTEGDEVIVEAATDPETGEPKDVQITDSENNQVVVTADMLNDPGNGSSPAENSSTNPANLALIYQNNSYHPADTIKIVNDNVISHSFTVPEAFKETEYIWELYNQSENVSGQNMENVEANVYTVNLPQDGHYSLHLIEGTTTNKFLIVNQSKGEVVADNPVMPDATDNVRIHFSLDNQEYKHGDVINIPYKSINNFVAFSLLNFPDGINDFDWSFIKDGEDITAQVMQNSSAYSSRFELNIGRQLGDVKLNVVCNNKKYELGINMLKEEFIFKDIYAKHKENRIARSGQTLYLVDNDMTTKNSANIRFDAGISPYDISSDKYQKNDIEWMYFDQDGNERKETGIKFINRTIHESDKPITTTLSTGYPERLEKSVNIEWVSENRKKVDVVPPGIELVLENSKEFLDQISDKLARVVGKKIEVTSDLTISEEGYNEEDNESNLYFNKKEGSINGGFTIAAELPVPGLSFSVPKVFDAGVFIKPSLGVSASGGLAYQKFFNVPDYEINVIFFKGVASGSVEGILKAEVAPSLKVVDISLAAYGKATLTGEIEYKIKINDNDEIKTAFILQPLVIGAKGTIKTDNEIIDITLLDVTYEVTVTDKIEWKNVRYLNF